jgi:hypothetical protein
MAKPPPDADPENFVIGQGWYSNLRTACVWHDDPIFRIDPAPMPVGSLVLYNLIFVVVGYGFHWALKNLTHGDAGQWAIYGPIGAGIVACGVFTMGVYFSFRNAQRLGPWLIYNKTTGHVELPREGVAFDRPEIVHLQYITTKRLAYNRVVNNERVSELNLITNQNGIRKRWPLLRSNANRKDFDHILTPLAQHTNIPVVRVQDQLLGWRVSETPYNVP